MIILQFLIKYIITRSDSKKAVCIISSTDNALVIGNDYVLTTPDLPMFTLTLGQYEIDQHTPIGWNSILLKLNAAFKTFSPINLLLVFGNSIISLPSQWSSFGAHPENLWIDWPDKINTGQQGTSIILKSPYPKWSLPCGLTLRSCIPHG